MKYICLGYLEPGKFENMSDSESHTVLDCRFEANALIEQGFEPASDGLVLGNVRTLSGLPRDEAQGRAWCHSRGSFDRVV